MANPQKIDAETRKAITRRMRSLEQITELIIERVEIHGTDVSFDVTRPANIDALLDNVMDDPELNLPYWAEIWPSGIALATELLLNPELVRSKPVIELGSGVGITAAAAMRAGADLTITDYSAHSLLLAEITCLRAGLPVPPSRQMNWRDSHAPLLQDSGEQWPVVLAADVLYEQRDIEPVLDTLDRITTRNGLVLLAEPGRRQAHIAIDLAQKRGWQIATRQHTGPWPDSTTANVVVSVHALSKSPLLH